MFGADSVRCSAVLGKSPNEISGILTTKLFSVNTAQDDVLLSAR